MEADGHGRLAERAKSGIIIFVDTIPYHTIPSQVLARSGLFILQVSHRYMWQPAGNQLVIHWIEMVEILCVTLKGLHLSKVCFNIILN